VTGASILIRSAVVLHPEVEAPHAVVAAAAGCCDLCRRAGRDSTPGQPCCRPGPGGTRRGWTVEEYALEIDAERTVLREEWFAGWLLRTMARSCTARLYEGTRLVANS